jgi:transcriptional regulator with XRE-family HTH domain
MGATLRQYRQQRRLSHKALAARMGIRPSYISEIELGKRNIAVLMLLRLARALDIPLAWLLAQLDPHATLAPAVTAEPLPAWKAGVTPHDTPSLHPHDPETLLHLLGTTIRQYRQSQGLTQTGLAAKTGLDNWYLSQIEQGQRNLSTLSLVRIADALGLAVSHLLRPLETYHNSSPTPE